MSRKLLSHKSPERWEPYPYLYQYFSPFLYSYLIFIWHWLCFFGKLSRLDFVYSITTGYQTHEQSTAAHALLQTLRNIEIKICLSSCWVCEKNEVILSGGGQTHSPFHRVTVQIDQQIYRLNREYIKMYPMCPLTTQMNQKKPFHWNE